MLRRVYWWLVQKIGYTIELIDTIDFVTWETTKNTHIALFKYLGRFKHDNSLKMKIVWKLKIK